MTDKVIIDGNWKYIGTFEEEGKYLQDDSPCPTSHWFPGRRYELYEDDKGKKHKVYVKGRSIKYGG